MHPPVGLSCHLAECRGGPLASSAMISRSQPDCHFSAKSSPSPIVRLNHRVRKCCIAVQKIYLKDFEVAALAVAASSSYDTQFRSV